MERTSVRICYWIGFFLILCEIVLGILHATFTWGEVERMKLANMFNVGKESNVPTWFSSSQFLLLGLVCGSICLLKKYLYPGNRFAYLWLVCAVGAVFLSVDESALIHETFGSVFGGYLDSNETPLMDRMLENFQSYYWALVYVPIALPVAIGLGVFFWKELGRYRYLPIIGMIVFLMGAVGVDFVEGTYYDVDEDEIVGFARWLVVDLDSYLIEEMAEMLGVTLVLVGCLCRAALLVPLALERLKGSDG